MDDRISQLPDDLLLKVLLFLPTKVAVSTCVLSKRWEFLWMWLSKLEYHSIDPDYRASNDRAKLRDFMDLNMPLHRALVIESFCLKLSKGSYRIINPTLIKVWVLIAVSRCVRELILDLSSCNNRRHSCLPSSLYTCKSIVILKLIDSIFVDVPRMACLPSLKTMFLGRVSYSNENSLHQLLSSCPVLEDLVLKLDGRTDSQTKNWRIMVTSLKRLTLNIRRCISHFDEVVINTPSLKYLKVTDFKDEYLSDNEDHSYSFKFKDMPHLEEAYIDSTYPDIDKFVRSITSVKRLSLCIKVNAEEDLYPEGIVFNQLEHLKLCPCHSNWSKLLVRLLKDSPNLRELEVSLNDDHTIRSVDPLVCWENQLNCLLSSLQTFKCTWIHGSPKVMDLAKYILRSVKCLKTATILLQPGPLETEDERETMIQDLLLSFPSSSTCQLILL